MDEYTANILKKRIPELYALCLEFARSIKEEVLAQQHCQALNSNHKLTHNYNHAPALEYSSVET